MRVLRGSKIRYLFLVGAFLIAFTPVFVEVAYALTLQQQRDALAAEARRNRELAAQKKKEAAELQRIISQIDKDISNTQYRINQTQNQINDVTAQIAQKEKELAIEQENQNEAIRTMYETANQNTLEILIGSENLSEVVTYGEYLEALEMRIENTIAEIEKLKKDLEAKRGELEKLKSQLQNQSQALQAQRQSKNLFLTQTKTAMNQYLTTAKSAETEIANIDEQLRRAIGGPMGDLYGMYIGTGTVIGYEGSTGNSTGPHVHLEVRQHGGYHGDGNINDFIDIGYGNASNPAYDCVIGQSVSDLGLNFGLAKPLYEPAHVTACFGVGGYGSGSWSGKFHGGVDTAAYYGAPIHASAYGKVIFQGWLEGGWGNAVVIYHGNGLWTLYGHMINS